MNGQGQNSKAEKDIRVIFMQWSQSFREATMEVIGTLPIAIWLRIVRGVPGLGT